MFNSTSILLFNNTLSQNVCDIYHKNYTYFYVFLLFVCIQFYLDRIETNKYNLLKKKLDENKLKLTMCCNDFNKCCDDLENSNLINELKCKDNLLIIEELRFENKRLTLERYKHLDDSIEYYENRKILEAKISNLEAKIIVITESKNNTNTEQSDDVEKYNGLLEINNRLEEKYYELVKDNNNLLRKYNELVNFL